MEAIGKIPSVDHLQAGSCYDRLALSAAGLFCAMNVQAISLDDLRLTSVPALMY